MGQGRCSTHNDVLNPIPVQCTEKRLEIRHFGSDRSARPARRTSSANLACSIARRSRSVTVSFRFARSKVRSMSFLVSFHYGIGEGELGFVHNSSLLPRGMASEPMRLAARRLEKWKSRDFSVICYLSRLGPSSEGLLRFSGFDPVQSDRRFRRCPQRCTGHCVTSARSCSTISLSTFSSATRFSPLDIFHRIHDLGLRVLARLANAMAAPDALIGQAWLCGKNLFNCFPRLRSFSRISSTP